MLRKLAVAGMLFTALLAVSCSKDKKDDPPASTRKVQFKAEAANGGQINVAVYGVDNNTQTEMNLSRATWSSPEITAPAGAYNAHIVINGSGPTDAATMKVQIYVDNQLKKEVAANPGKVLSINTGFVF